MFPYSLTGATVTCAIPIRTGLSLFMFLQMKLAFEIDFFSRSLQIPSNISEAVKQACDSGENWSVTY